MSHRKIITMELSDLDVTLLLEALGAKLTSQSQNYQHTKAVQILIDRIYRAMGVRLDR